MKITVLNENTAGKRGILAEHGLSLLIERGESRYLFDTGQSDVFLRNAGTLHVDLKGLDGIILSHGHFDHCGGLEYLGRQGELPKVYVREEAFQEKTAVNPDRITYRKIGIPWKRETVKNLAPVVEDLYQVEEGMYLLGNIPCQVEFEPWGNLFFIGEGEKKAPDYMKDEQMFVIDGEKGLSIFAGCCHAGIVNCLTYVKSMFPGKKLYSVLAGMHLTGCGTERIKKTIEALGEMEIEILIPVHCTGLEGIGRMKTAFGERCLLVESGKVFEL